MEMPPIPERMQKLPLWRGKFPIHYTVWINEDGNPDFKVMHETKRQECFKNNLCHLCGESLGGERKPYLGKKTYKIVNGKMQVGQGVEIGFHGGQYTFIGGPLCVEQHRFVDGAMHVECAEYAAKACPYLAAPSGIYIADVPVVTEVMNGVRVISDKNRINTRPEKMALVVTNEYRVERNTVVHKFTGGSHASDPNAPKQLVSVVGEYSRVDWLIMPQVKEKGKV